MPCVLMAMGLDCIHQTFGVDPFEWFLPCRIDVGDDKHVCLIKGACKFLKAILRPGVAMRLEHNDNAMIPGLSGSIESRPHFCGMVPIIIDHGDAACLSFDLKAGSAPRKPSKAVCSVLAGIPR